MKETNKQKKICWDCRKPIEGKPLLAIRNTGAGGHRRMPVCARCQLGVFPVKKSALSQ